MRQFFTFVFAFMLTTILVVAVPHGDYSLNDQKASGAADVQEMNPEPDVVDTAPETVALTDQKTSLIAPDSDNTDENNPGIEFASNSSPAPESKDPETGGTSVTPSKEFPDTPVRANCAVGAVDWFPVFQCPLDTTLFNRGYEKGCHQSLCCKDEGEATMFTAQIRTCEDFGCHDYMDLYGAWGCKTCYFDGVNVITTGCPPENPDENP